MELSGKSKFKRFELIHRPRAGKKMNVKRLIKVSRMCVESRGGGIHSVSQGHVSK